MFISLVSEFLVKNVGVIEYNANSKAQVTTLFIETFV